MSQPVLLWTSYLKTSRQDVMQNIAITCVTNTKFLGVIIDHKFKWKEHITYCQK